MSKFQLQGQFSSVPLVKIVEAENLRLLQNTYCITVINISSQAS